MSIFHFRIMIFILYLVNFVFHGTFYFSYNKVIYITSSSATIDFRIKKEEQFRIACEYVLQIHFNIYKDKDYTAIFFFR